MDTKIQNRFLVCNMQSIYCPENQGKLGREVEEAFGNQAGVPFLGSILEMKLKTQLII